MKRVVLGIVILALSYSLALYGQAFRIDSVGDIYLNGQTGRGMYTPQLNIFSQSTSLEGINGALNLCNTSTFPHHTIRLSFLTHKNNGEIEDLEK